MSVAVSRSFVDAGEIHASALERSEQGDIRDAAEKAWRATKRAADALILAWTGEEPEKSPYTGIGLDWLVATDPRRRSLVGRYYSRRGAPHGDCFYLGICEPLPAIVRRIRETLQYIHDAEALADFQPFPFKWRRDWVDPPCV